MFFACSVWLYAAGAGLPEARQVDLTVVEEEADGSCTVRWEDPYQGRTREADYQCDPGRSELLKAPRYSDSRGYGWDTAYMLTEGPQRGNLEELAAGEQGLNVSDVCLLLGASLIALGLVGGNLRALPRVLGVRARVVRRAAELSEAAEWVAEDYERVVSVVREEGRHPDALAQGSGGADGSRLVTGLWVLREAGPRAGETAALARRLTRRLQGLLDDAAPAAGLRSRLRAGPVARSDADRAVAELRLLLADAERDGLAERFAQTSVDLLRGQDAERAVLAATADFAREPDAYRLLLAEVAGPAVVPWRRRVKGVLRRRRPSGA
ncbi:hypothetical protein [Streptomyces sp. B93]|uniref:hypothetical protein n=1 Tax=Streptomyces sp. B93 TaxID=2824875 RepID=UPI001B397225|nr:hypothetical protein [Streptomyces sp. B93]MBQ1093487.1 hypothetical protein [Streptomyces sp. B93]